MIRIILECGCCALEAPNHTALVEVIRKHVDWTVDGSLHAFMEEAARRIRAEAPQRDIFLPDRSIGIDARASVFCKQLLKYGLAREFAMN